ncbi:EAL domain-containing protein [Herbaspirillum seropedicae]|uniref:EAL domain containing protein n=1 Tax=Herbaspirillum seropedicae (strain SmR1) TaxID=757424 RepID=D8IWN5_HERSS|nr:EAL domain-containing protein [Herbaspirillum seropedicae]ADJ64055.1 EAL domain containing protein [Herbaspirillum seropedicae SmR1]AKN66019.1 diguanylate phosphodiesterase [Herbaspirillum seropedicae]MDR6394062.1 diguanylate cyclase (GGDEF)-like protein/PAS domain S-box-containing protein [Herbaspirillum seropedicae]NQE29163.1 diguanylate phosphodiesterase [Herbaspirillum seropedicae]UMU22009.1 EAL domain-containing protein [Herbaspirillum seropedicae]
MNWIRLILLPLVILVTGLGVTWTAWNHEREAANKELHTQFASVLRETVSRIEQRMASYEQMLHGVQGLVAATGAIDRSQFRDYVQALNLDANFSGIQAIAVEEWVPAAALPAHLARMERQGLEGGYQIRPAGERSAYAPTVLREPYVGRNRTPFGFDQWSDPVRRSAMEKARDSGMATISGKVEVLAADGQRYPTFMMYLPLYERGKPPTTIAQRRASLVGWVHATFRMSDVIASLYGENSHTIVFSLYDGVQATPQALLYQSRQHEEAPQATRLSADEYVVVGNHNWTLTLRTNAAFHAQFGRNAEPLIATTGIAMSLSLALLAWLMVSSRVRAVRLAQKMTAELRASEEQFRAIADCTVNWEVWWGLDGRPRWINHAVLDYTGYTVEECLAMDDFIGTIAHPEDEPRIRAELARCMDGQKREDVELRCVRKDGSVFWLALSCAPIHDAQGRFTGFRTSSRDITDRKQIEAELRISAVAFDSREGMLITDANSKILRVNKAFTEITGYSAEEIVGKHPNLLRSDRHGPAFFQEMRESIRRFGKWQGEIWDRRKNGEVYPEWLTISAVKNKDQQVTHYVSTHHDISDRKLAEERIRELAFFDALTRLPNRTLLLDRLKQAIALSLRTKTCAALLFIDLDHFKTLNDTIGHEKGDTLLKQVAQRLLANVRENDTVARVGGDEFVVVLEGLNELQQEAATQTRAIGEKILTALGSTYQLDDVEYRTTASIGATVFLGRAASVDELMKQADLAMYKAKETGRNALRFFDPAMQTAVLERATLEAGLRKAIDGNQLLLHYQPQVVEGGRVTGAEVLVRWQHPQRGMVPPGDFIPLAEETGLILSLGNWVLETACRQLATWAAQPQMADLSIAVNVSAPQLREPDFVQTVLDTIERTGANPRRLKLELTESLLVDNVEDIIQKMFALKAYGVEFSLDDFGTGYSSLSYLKRLPLNQLKIDQSFVRDVLIDPNDASIAKTIVNLAQSLGLGVIAEGVETDAQRSFLADAGCHAYQGYFFCRPVTVEAFEKFAQEFDPQFSAA